MSHIMSPYYLSIVILIFLVLLVMHWIACRVVRIALQRHARTHGSYRILSGSHIAALDRSIIQHQYLANADHITDLILVQIAIMLVILVFIS